MRGFLLVFCVGSVLARSAIRHTANEADYMPQGKHDADYDHEAFLGSNKQEFDSLTAAEAQQRLWNIIPHLDEDGDGNITVDELHDWIKRQLLVYIMEDAKGLHEGNDVNHDGFVSWKEFVATTYGLGFVDNEQKAPEAGQFDYRELILRDYNKFISADANGDQFLSVEEMGAFVHPEEFHHTRHLAIEESMADLDRNKDGKVSLEEYIADILADEEEHANSAEWLELERKSFLEHRDKDGDGLLSLDELRDWLQPEGRTPALTEARHLVQVSDRDKNGVLSAKEIVDSYQVFVGSQVTDYGRMLHTEL